LHKSFVNTAQKIKCSKRTTSLLPCHSAYLRKSALNCKKILNCKKFAVNSHLHIFLFYSLFNPRRKNLRKSIIREKSYHHYAYILIMKRKINFLTEYRLLSKFCTIFIQFEGQKGRWRMHISSRNSLHNYSFSCIYFIDCLCHYVKLQHQNMTYWRRHSCKIQFRKNSKNRQVAKIQEIAGQWYIKTHRILSVRLMTFTT
jgi:hypothetical protein